MNPSIRRPMLRLVINDAAPRERVSPAGNTRPAPAPQAPAQARRLGTPLRPALRIAGQAGRERDRVTPAIAAAQEAIARETRLASGMQADDARWVFARRVAENLDGGKAAILTPEKRGRLLATARRVGLRDFDANMVIALVQDARRAGAGALNPEVERSLLMLRPAEPRKGVPDAVRFLIASVILGGLMAWGMACWVG